MNLNEIILQEINKENNNPTWSKHHIPSYLTNLGFRENDHELLAISDLFDGAEKFIPLYQRNEFKKGVFIDVHLEMIDQDDRDENITYRKTVFHNHDFFELIYVFSGQCKTTINNTEVTLQEGEICLFNLQAVHQVVFTPDSAVFNILISKELLNDTFLRQFDQNDFISSFFMNSLYSSNSISGYSIFKLNEYELYTIQHIITEFITQKTYYERIMRLNFTELMLSLARERRNDNTAVKTKEGTLHTNDVLNYIYQNYNTITLEELADHFGYSARTMTRFFKQNINCSFKDIILECRINNACRYLSTSQQSIDEIAYLCGFSDRSYFDKVFKKVLNMTPRTYINKVQEILY